MELLGHIQLVADEPFSSVIRNFRAQKIGSPTLSSSDTSSPSSLGISSRPTSRSPTMGSSHLTGDTSSDPLEGADSPISSGTSPSYSPQPVDSSASVSTSEASGSSILDSDRPFSSPGSITLVSDGIVPKSNFLNPSMSPMSPLTSSASSSPSSHSSPGAFDLSPISRGVRLILDHSIFAPC